MRIKIISILVWLLIFTTVFMAEIPAIAKVQVTEEWTVKYNSPENNIDGGRAIAVDHFGNIYVTGCSYNKATWFDYLTIAYDPNGNELWTARYNGPENRHDYPFAIAIDSSRNVYATGGSNGDFATVAYDSLGNELWVARYNGPEKNSQDDAYDIAVGSSGNIYVGGTSWGNGTGYDLAVVAYDSSGNELWVRRYNGPEGGNDACYGIEVDSSENVYVAGHIYTTKTDCDYAILAYDRLGKELWAVTYNSPGNGSDRTRAIATDPNGIIYVSGTSDGDYVTVAYDSSGNELWVAKYNGPGNGHDEPVDIVGDSSGNVYVTGNSFGNGTHDDYATVAYDSLGNELWVTRYNGPGNHDDLIYGIALDPSGNIYVTGWSDGGVSGTDYATVAYDSLGNELWVARYDETRGDRAFAIGTDSSGNVYVTGDTYCKETSYDIITIKYSQELINIQSTIDIDPDTLNLKSKGRWITCYINLPNGYDVNDIDISTVMLEDTIPAEWGDTQGDTLMVKFDRSEVEEMLLPGTYNLKVTGQLMDRTSFEGYSDEVRVIEPP